MGGGGGRSLSWGGVFFTFTGLSAVAALKLPRDHPPTPVLSLGFAAPGWEGEF